MQPKDFLYFLTDEQGRSYRVNNGIVQTSSTPTPLTVTPDGWQDKTIQYNRSTKYSLLFRSFTNPLKYVKDAALIVRNQLYKYGTESKLYQVIHRLDKNFLGGWVHRFFYKGELDLSQAEDNDFAMTVPIMEGDLIKLFKANENTTYELDVDVPEAVTGKMDGHFLNEKHNFLIPAIELAGAHLLYIQFINKEGTAFGVTPFNVFGHLGLPNYTTSLEYFEAITQDVQGMVLSGQVIFDCSSSGVYVLAIHTSTGRTLELYNNFVNDGQSYTIDINYTFDVFAGENLFLTGGGFNGPSGTGANYIETRLSLSFKSRYKTTFIKGLRPSYVAQKLLDKITGGGYTFSSTYLSTVWENLLVTSGDAIRGIPGAKVKISWADFFDSYNIPCNLCAGIRNQVLFVEEKAKAFQATILQNMGEATGLTISPAKDYQYNTINIGYPDTDTEDVNGKDEFNVTQSYTTPITRVSKALDLVSKIRASMYEIEITRINLDGKTTTDDNNDSNNYFLHVEKTATTGTGNEPATYYKLLRNTYDSVTGLLNPSSAFNVELHPELCLYRHGDFIRSVLYWNETKYIVYQKSNKNGNVNIVKSGQTYVGNKNIRIGGLTAPLFIPLEFKFDSPMPYTIIDTMDTGPDGTFSFTYEGLSFYGFPMEVSIQPSNRPSQETTLLCSPVTDLTQLITISR